MPSSVDIIAKPSTQQILDDEKVTTQGDPLYLIESELLSIKTKKGELIKLKLNSAQTLFHKMIEELRAKKKPIRIWLLKFRQGGMCLSPDTRVLTSDLNWITLDDICAGQEIVAVDENPGSTGRKLRTGVVEVKKEIIGEAFKITMEDGRVLIATGEHRFLSRRTNGSDTQWKAIKKRKIVREALLQKGDVVRHITHPWGMPTYEDGWFGGMIDGEGAVRKMETGRAGYDLKLTQRPGPVCDRMRDYLTDNGYAIREYLDERLYQEGGKFSNNPVTKLEIGRIDELFRLIGTTRPSRLMGKHWWAGKSLPCRGKGNSAWIKIVDIDPIGKQRMIDLQTSTKTFIAEGMVSHNSTYIEALIYALTSQKPNRNALIMADEKEHSGNLFEMSKLYQEKLEKDEPHLAPKLKKSNEKKLEWDEIHSQVIIATAENTEAARSHTYQIVHLSEVAFFRDLKTVMDGLNQSVPDHHDTIIIGETTANGMNPFYKEWMRSIEGKTDWIPIFLPWFLMEEYSKPLESGKLYPIQGVNFDSDTSESEFVKEEGRIKVEFELEPEQLNWRRWAIVNKCSGSLTTFRTEYPITWEEAFSMTGEMYFDRKGLDMQRKMIQRPLAIGEIFEQDMGWEFRTLKEGRIDLYTKPIPGEQYIVAADGSEGLGVDEAGIVVLNKRTNTTVAVVAGQYTPEEIAHMSIALGNYYNKAIVAPENKGYGYMICQLVHKKYGNIYKRIKHGKGEAEETEELGFNTNGVTRPQYLAQLNQEIKEGTTTLVSKKITDECQTFVNKKDKDGRVIRVEAQSGCQDGLVICRAIAGIVRQQHPYKVVSKAGKAKRRARYNQITKKSNGGFGFK